MRVVLTKKMVVGHVMRYAGEVVELPDGDPSTPAAASAQDDMMVEVPSTPAAASAQDDSATPRRKGRKQT
jgi:hypothetical protein